MDTYLAAVQRALDHIEANLREPLPLETIARKAGFSLWHFQRIFAAFTGESIASYVRRRRLTSATQDLRASSRRILDIALDYQFESHEAFTRAFKTVFDFTPGDFRRNRRIQWVNIRPPLADENLKHLSRITMEPKIISLPALTLLGLETRFICAMSPDANNLDLIPPLFQRLGSRWGELPPRLDGFTYGVCDCLPPGQRTHDDEMIYLAGVSVQPAPRIPLGMTVWQVPSRTYAHFTHRGPIGRLNETINYIYGAWFPRSGYEHIEGQELERYDDRFGDGGETSELDLLFPVQQKRR